MTSAFLGIYGITLNYWHLKTLVTRFGNCSSFIQMINGNQNCKIQAIHDWDFRVSAEGSLVVTENGDTSTIHWQKDNNFNWNNKFFVFKKHSNRSGLDIKLLASFQFNSTLHSVAFARIVIMVCILQMNTEVI